LARLTSQSTDTILTFFHLRRETAPNPHELSPPPPTAPQRQAACVPRAVRCAEQRSPAGGARSALRDLTRRGCLSGVRDSERSEFCGAPAGWAAQGSRPWGPTAPVRLGDTGRLPLRASAPEPTCSTAISPPTSAGPMCGGALHTAARSSCRPGKVRGGAG